MKHICCAGFLLLCAAVSSPGVAAEGNRQSTPQVQQLRTSTAAVAQQ